MKRRYEEEEEEEDTGPGLVNLDISGVPWALPFKTLVESFPQSKIAKLVREKVHEQGSIYIDTDPLLFRYIAHVLRRPSLLRSLKPHDVPPEMWLAELEHFNIVAPVSVKEEEAEAAKEAKEAKSESIYKYFTDLEGGSVIFKGSRPEKKPRLFADHFKAKQLECDTLCVESLLKSIPVNDLISKGVHSSKLYMPHKIFVDGFDMCDYLKNAFARVCVVAKELTGITLSNFAYCGSAKRDSVKYTYDSVEYDTSVINTYSMDYTFRETKWVDDKLYLFMYTLLSRSNMWQ